MNTTSKKQAVKPVAKKPPSKSVPLRAGKNDQETKLNHAALMVSPELATYRILSSVDSKGGYSQIWDEIDTPSLMNHLRDQAAAANKGDMQHAEAMLINQATALQSLFSRLIERGMNQEHMPNIEGFMKLALRAQNQCRATLETLATIKNPPVIFAKQANINHGNQQVNNGATASATHTKEIANEPNKLLEADHGSKTLDTRATCRTSRKNPSMATVD